jgi:hypothetical protein
MEVGAVVGHIRHFREELADAMTVVEALLSSPAQQSGRTPVRLSTGHLSTGQLP